MYEITIPVKNKYDDNDRFIEVLQGNARIENGDVLILDERDDEEHHILHSYRRGSERVFICSSPPDPEAPVVCEYCLEPQPIPTKAVPGEGTLAEQVTRAILSRHGLAPAVNGRHRILHRVSLENPDSFIPCRKSGEQAVDTSAYAWSDNYQNAPPAQS
jgi:hypothetical protein